MPTLLELTQQVDPGTVADEGKLGREIQLMTPQQLYELWERQHWLSQDIDLEPDKRTGRRWTRSSATTSSGTSPRSSSARNA